MTFWFRQTSTHYLLALYVIEHNILLITGIAVTVNFMSRMTHFCTMTAGMICRSHGCIINWCAIPMMHLSGENHSFQSSFYCCPMNVGDIGKFWHGWIRDIFHCLRTMWVKDIHTLSASVFFLEFLKLLTACASINCIFSLKLEIRLQDCFCRTCAPNNIFRALYRLPWYIFSDVCANTVLSETQIFVHLLFFLLVTTKHCSCWVSICFNG